MVSTRILMKTGSFQDPARQVKERI